MLNTLQRSLLLEGAVLLALIIRSESTILPDCDSLGTLWRMSSINHCVCRPYFYGTFCHRIRRCVSGKPVPVNCTNSERYAQHASQRCTSAKSFVDICECFEGYTGPLCERFSVKSSSDYGSPSTQTQQMHRSSYLIHANKNMLVDQGDWQSYRSTQWIIFFILHLVLVIVGMAAVSLAMICYYRQTRWREERHNMEHASWIGSLEEKEEQVKDAHHSNGYEVVPQMQSNEYNKTYFLPPRYEEVTEEHQNFEVTHVGCFKKVESTPYIMCRHAPYHKPLNTTIERKSIHLHV